MAGLKPTSMEQFDTVKVVIFREVSPLSDTFQQLALTERQFKTILKAITDNMQPDNTPCACGKVHKGGFITTTNDEHEYDFEDIPQFYPASFFQKENENVE